MPAIRSDDTLLRLIRDLNEVRSILRQVVATLPLFDIDNENTPDQLTAAQYDDYVPGNYDVLRLSSSQNVRITGTHSNLPMCNPPFHWSGCSRPGQKR